MARKTTPRTQAEHKAWAAEKNRTHPLHAAGEPPKLNVEAEPMVGNFNVRVPLAFVNWLHDQAAEDGTSISEVIRNCVAAEIVRHGDHVRYGIPLVHEDEPA